MTAIAKNRDMGNSLVWFAFPFGLFLFASLWFSPSLPAHLLIWGLVITLALRRRITLRTVLQRVLPMLIILFLAQILLSEYSRTILMETLRGGGSWSDWRYPFQAVERLALPLVAVLALQRELSSPSVMATLGAFSQPLKWLGLPVRKFQVMFAMSIRFLPILREEWERFQTVAAAFGRFQKESARTLRSRIKQHLIIFKAMLSQIIRRAVSTGDMLALRGTIILPHALDPRHFALLILSWLGVGALFLPGMHEAWPLWLGIALWYMAMQASLPGSATV